MHDSAFHSHDSIQGSPDIGATVTVRDPSYKYRAAVEEFRSGVSKGGLCRVWESWRDRPGQLINMLHGAWMLSENCSSQAMCEIDFLIDLLEQDK